ncbi:MAG: Xaa-Pro peptidase family protein [Oscillospiraceae bacterium]|jgi:Xaa-Pro aminopeptidase|nr:Xaa-Pro peptidase family protein [Oscillospiraceae bacterium]
MNNIQKIKQSLPEYNCDAMLIYDMINRSYATGFNSSAGFVLVTENNAWSIVDSRYYEAAKNTITDANVVLVEKNEKFYDTLDRVIKEANVKAIGFEADKVTFSVYSELCKRFPDVEFVDAQKLIASLRNIKSRVDVDNMIKAQRLAEKVFDEILPLISTDLTEKDLAAEIIYRSLKNGADDRAFDPIVVSGANSSRPHGVPSNDKITKGFLTIDFGVRLNGWCSDTTRTLCIGRPSEEMVNIYNTVLKAQEAGIAAVCGGVSGVNVDAAARNVIEDAGYGEFFGHGFGHSIGMEVHESLSASPLSKDILPAGAVISAEPGIYIPGKYGVRIEDILFITDNGCENITKLPKEMIIINF